LAINASDYTTTSNTCNLQFGIVNAIDLPGTTPQDITSQNLGAPASPTQGKDLVLHDVKTSARYSLPTFEYSYPKNDINYKASFSIVLLRDNRRAYVRRYCASPDPNPAVLNANMAKVNEKANQVKIDTGK
jgi:hypothetical protein